MKPENQPTFTVVERIYAELIRVKSEQNTVSYSDCFANAFNMPYEKKYCHLIQERKVVNNIPLILGEIGFVCNERGFPPLSCLVVNQARGQCGNGVVVSNMNIPQSERPEFAEKIDLPAVYNCNNYPQPGSQEATDFLHLVMKRLSKNGLTRS